MKILRMGQNKAYVWDVSKDFDLSYHDSSREFITGIHLFTMYGIISLTCD